MPRTPINILEKRGYFWFHGEAIPDSRFAPATAVPGLLVIDENGLTTLRLDGSLLHLDFPNGLPFDTTLVSLDGRTIAGRIIEDRNCVYLQSLAIKDFDQTNRHVTSEEYRADSCLVGCWPTNREAESFCLVKQSISMKGLEEWRRGDAIDVALLDVDGLTQTHKVEYTDTRNSYDIDGGQLVVRSDVYLGSWPGMKTREINFRQEDWLDYLPNVEATPEEMKQEFALIEEFLAILTGSYYSLDWPRVSSNSGKGGSRTRTLSTFGGIFKKHLRLR